MVFIVLSCLSFGIGYQDSIIIMLFRVVIEQSLMRCRFMDNKLKFQIS